MNDVNSALRAMVREEVRKVLPELLPSKDEYLSTKQVAAYTGLSVGFFEMGRSRGAKDQPPYHRVGRRIVYKRCEVDEWMDGRKRA